MCVFETTAMHTHMHDSFIIMTHKLSGLSVYALEPVRVCVLLNPSCGDDYCKCGHDDDDDDGDYIAENPATMICNA